MYQQKALTTKSPNFYPKKINWYKFRGALKIVIRAAHALDKQKRLLFYEQPGCEPEVQSHNMPNAVFDYDQDAKDQLHAIIGIITEAGEIAEILTAALSGHPHDITHIKEELGDLEWYMALFREACGLTQEEVQEANIRKLEIRNRGNKFDAEGTNPENRNEFEERAALDIRPDETELDTED